MRPHCAILRRCNKAFLHQSFVPGCFGMSITLNLVWLFALAIPIACVAWTVTHEEIFREPREYCKR